MQPSFWLSGERWLPDQLTGMACGGAASLDQHNVWILLAQEGVAPRRSLRAGLHAVYEGRPDQRAQPGAAGEGPLTPITDYSAARPAGLQPRGRRWLSPGDEVDPDRMPVAAREAGGSRMIRWLPTVSMSTACPREGVDRSHDQCQASGGAAHGEPPWAVRYTATGAPPSRTRNTVASLPGSVVSI
jgi:hypothetical protein